MAKNKEEKTNVVRILEAAGIPCTAYEVPLPKGKVPDGVTAAGLLGKPVEQVFKTLVAQGPKGEHFVYVIPVAETLDLKKAARAAGVKSVSHAPPKAAAPPHRLCPRGLLAGGDVQVLSHLLRGRGDLGGHHDLLRREKWGIRWRWPPTI